ncbi:MAG: hypothetical protein LBQ98_03490 [Nitrososphaerota archaeon]|jgi:hypothetical protein|nr:hypothetical protein [Nitrososphaerota archaeon]
MEAIKDVIPDSVYGIATVQPDHAVKRCRIRKMRIEYYLNEFAIILVIPHSCGKCEKTNDCTNDFIMQITNKFNSNNNNRVKYNYKNIL